MQRCEPLKLAVKSHDLSLFEAATDARRPITAMILTLRDETGLADACSTAFVTGFTLIDFALRINEACTVALTTLRRTMALGAFARSVLLEIEFPLLEDLALLVDDGKKVVIVPVPIHRV